MSVGSDDITVEILKGIRDEVRGVANRVSDLEVRVRKLESK